MIPPRLPAPLRALRLGRALLLSGALAVLLLVCRQNAAAGGALMGFALFAGNALLLYESGRVLLASASGSPRGGRATAAASTASRLLFLGFCLAGVFFFLGRSTGLGACGGLLVSQVNLHLPIRSTGVAT